MGAPIVPAGQVQVVGNMATADFQVSYFSQLD